MHRTGCWAASAGAAGSCRCWRSRGLPASPTNKAGSAARWWCSRRLGGDAKAPFFALLTQGFPRLVTVSRDALVAQEREGELPAGVRAYVLLNEDEALVPDLEDVERMIGDALAAAA